MRHTSLFLSILILGLSSGLPLVLIGSTLQAWFTEAHQSLLDIGFLSLVGIPYTYKFIWAPLLDFYIPPFLGQRRGWIVIFQIFLLILFLNLSFLNPSQHAFLMGLTAFIIAFCSASQDVSISAYLVDIKNKTQDQGLIASAYIIGYRLAMILSGAGALILAQRIDFNHAYQIICCFALIILSTTFFIQEPLSHKKPISLKNSITQPFLNFFKKYPKKIILLFLLILIFYKFGEAFLFSFNTTFLIRGLHYSLTQIALANKILAVGTAIIGSLLAGLLLRKISLFQGLILFGVLQALSNLSYVLLAYLGPNHFYFLLGAIFVEYFSGALASTAFLALTLHLCDKTYAATQYALLNALESLGRVYIGPAAGFILTYFSLSWVNFYWLSFLLAWPALLLIIPVRKYLN